MLAVFTTDQVEDVVEHALVPAAAGKIVLCTCTCDPDRIAALGARVAERLRFLEMPVSGTSEQVRQGDGVALLGGEERLAEAAPVLEALFPQRFFIGKVGDGGRAKAGVDPYRSQSVGAGRRARLCRAARARSGGIADVARSSAAASQVMDTKGPKMACGDFTRRAGSVRR